MRGVACANRGELIEDEFRSQSGVDSKVIRLGNELRTKGDVNDRGRCVDRERTRCGNDLTGRVHRRSGGTILVRACRTGSCWHDLSPLLFGSDWDSVLSGNFHHRVDTALFHRLL